MNKTKYFMGKEVVFIGVLFLFLLVSFAGAQTVGNNVIEIPTTFGSKYLIFSVGEVSGSNTGWEVALSYQYLNEPNGKPFNVFVNEIQQPQPEIVLISKNIESATLTDCENAGLYSARKTSGFMLSLNNSVCILTKDGLVGAVGPLGKNEGKAYMKWKILEQGAAQTPSDTSTIIKIPITGFTLRYFGFSQGEIVDSVNNQWDVSLAYNTGVDAKPLIVYPNRISQALSGVAYIYKRAEDATLTDCENAGIYNAFGGSGGGFSVGINHSACVITDSRLVGVIGPIEKSDSVYSKWKVLANNVNVPAGAGGTQQQGINAEYINYCLGDVVECEHKSRLPEYPPDPRKQIYFVSQQNTEPYISWIDVNCSPNRVSFVYLDIKAYYQGLEVYEQKYRPNTCSPIRLTVDKKIDNLNITSNYGSNGSITIGYKYIQKPTEPLPPSIPPIEPSQQPSAEYENDTSGIGKLLIESAIKDNKEFVGAYNKMLESEYATKDIQKRSVLANISKKLALFGQHLLNPASLGKGLVIIYKKETDNEIKKSVAKAMGNLRTEDTFVLLAREMQELNTEESLKNILKESLMMHGGTAPKIILNSMKINYCLNPNDKGVFKLNREVRNVEDRVLLGFQTKEETINKVFVKSQGVWQEAISNETKVIDVSQKGYKIVSFEFSRPLYFDISEGYVLSVREGEFLGDGLKKYPSLAAATKDPMPFIGQQLCGYDYDANKISFTHYSEKEGVITAKISSGVEDKFILLYPVEGQNNTYSPSGEIYMVPESCGECIGSSYIRTKPLDRVKVEIDGKLVLSVERRSDTLGVSGIIHNIRRTKDTVIGLLCSIGLLCPP